MIRRVSGYGLDALVDPETVDLTRLVCGSEGTLAVVTRADFRLAELPPRRGARLPGVRQSGGRRPRDRRAVEARPSALEMLDDVAIGRARASTAYAGSTRFVQGDPKALLLVEWSGTPGADERFAGLEEMPVRSGRSIRRRCAPRVRCRRRSSSASPYCRSCLALRRGEARRLRGGRGCAAGPARGVYRTLRGDSGEERHLGLLLRPRERRVPARQAGARHLRPRRGGEDATHRRGVADLVVDCGGSLSASTATVSPARFLERMYGPEILRAFSEVKALFDPEGMLNPGVIVAPRRWTGSSASAPVADASP